MIRLTLIAATFAALVLPAVASAKGPTEGSVSGPGFSKVVKVLYDGGGGSAGDNLTQESGFFPAAFGQSPDPMLHSKPAGPLGPRYTIAWTGPGGGGGMFHIRQDLYPYARGGAVTYTKPGQPIFGATTRGGWYRGPALKRTLVGMGLAATAPSDSDGTNWTLIGSLLAVGAVGAVILVLWLRHRGQRSPSTSSTELPAGSRT